MNSSMVSASSVRLLAANYQAGPAHHPHRLVYPDSLFYFIQPEIFYVEKNPHN